MPLLHRAKKDKVAAAPTLTSELPPSPPASNSRNSFNSSGVNSSSARSENQGNVMVTTTTTTVTTTTSNAGPHSSEPRVESRNQGDYNSSTSDFSGAGPYGPGSRQSDYNRPEPMNHGYEAPHIPPRNNMRNQYPETGGAGSGSGYGPPDPNSSSPNFSRPRGTVEGIKSAAHGIHGAGEVLRGTFNSAVDRSLHLPPEVVQQDRNVAYNGRREIREGYRPGHHMGQTGGSSRPLPAVDERTTIL